jgi:signal transduction histidine kinase/CheY-like chemotaxis protein/integral membrane sensor domain MASE1
LKRAIIHILISAGLYFIFSKFGLMLAIPPGFASAVWPASGTALVCVLLLRRSWALVGIMLGSFIINLGIASNNYSDISFAAIVPALSIAIGAMLQALFGSHLFKRWLTAKSMLDTPKDVTHFIFGVAPIGCLIAASVGVSTLFFNNIIITEDVGFHWLTWWVGDTIGVLLFTPLLLVLYAQKKQLSNARKIQIVVPTLCIFSAALLLFYASTTYRYKTLSDEISKNAQRIFRQIEESFRLSEQKLLAFEAFYQSSNSVTRGEFNTFSKLLLKDDKIFKGIGWSKIVHSHERQEIEREFQDFGFTNFTFTELSDSGEIIKAPWREEYFPVLFIYPMATNANALGLNIASNPIRHTAIIKAITTQKPISTAPITLVQGTENSLGIIMYYPIFNKISESLNDSLDAHKKNLRGIISGVFQVDGLLHDVLDDITASNYSLTLIDISDKNSPSAILASNRAALPHFSPITSIFEFGNRQIEATFFPTLQFSEQNRDWASWLVLTSCFFLTAMLQTLILMLSGINENIRLEVKQKTKALQKATDIAVKASLAKSEFTANISHEIRTPLNAITGFINLTLKTKLTDIQLDYLSKSKLACGTLASVINQTLDFSKIEAGKLTIAHEVFDISELISKLQAIFSMQAMQQNLDFNIKLPEVCPKYLIGDVLRIEQILLNLCSNAFKFTEKGNITLDVSATRISASKLNLRFIISDTGIGITKEQQQQLFDSFHQADSTISRKYGGSGLGLTITQQLIKLMNGSIEVTSIKDQGSKFTVTLPLTIEKDNEVISASDFISSVRPFSDDKRNDLDSHEFLPQYSPTKIKQSEPQRSNTSSIKSKTGQLQGLAILLAEDVKLNQIIAKAMLEEHGATVTLANNGIEAVNMLAEINHFDLVLMDIQMPEMDGYQATKLIREQDTTKNLPIVAMTANVMDNDIKRCLEAGMNGHIAKPLEESDVLAKIKQVI